MSDNDNKVVPKARAGSILKELNKGLQTLDIENPSIISSAKHYALYMSIAKEIIVFVDKEARSIFISPNWESISGYSISENSYSPIDEAIIHPEDYEHVNLMVTEQLISGHMNMDTEYRIKHKNGDWRWYKATIMPVRNDEGEIESLMLVIGDISMKKETEQIARSSDAKFRLLFETMREGVVIVDNDDIVQFINQSCCDIFGYQPKDLIGKAGNEYLIIEEDRHVIIQKNIARQQGVHDEYEVRGRKTNGELIWLQIKGAPLLDEDGIVIGSVGIMSDITESKSLREQLLASQKMEAIGRLAGGVAHDFNNLMTIILGYSEDLLDDLPADSPLKDDVQEIIKAGERAAGLTRQLLTFGNKQVMQARILDINEIILGLKLTIARLLGEGILLHYDLMAQSPRVKADNAQIELMLMNLIINAKEAMPNGGSLMLETSNLQIDEKGNRHYPKLAAGHYVKIVVSDTGVGMDDNVLSRVFEPFFSTKEMGRGVGLGLSTVYGIVKQFEGYISAKSSPGKGSNFSIVLPAESEQEPKQASKPKESSYMGKGEHIMVVEDEKSLLSYFSKLIRNLGYKVTATSDSREALEIIKQGLKPDLLITDVVMPNMNGRELADKILAIIPNLHVLFMSGYTDDEVVKNEVCNKGVPFIQKPFNSREIAIQIRGLLDSHKPDKQQARILMLDDEDGIRTLFERACKKRGHIFCGFSTLDEALASLSNAVYDVLLVDMNLIGMDGEHALRKIRESGVNTPAIILSGAIHPEMKEKLQSLGVVDTVEKSFDNQPLLQFIEGMIGGHG